MHLTFLPVKWTSSSFSHIKYLAEFPESEYSVNVSLYKPKDRGAVSIYPFHLCPFSLETSQKMSTIAKGLWKDHGLWSEKI